MKSLLRVLTAFFVIFLFTLSLFLIRSNNTSAPDYPIQNSVAGLQEVVIEVPQGASGSEIADILFENGVIKSTASYFRLAVSDKRSEKVAPGLHRVTLRISASQALEQLLDSERIPNLIRINEGAWKSEITQKLIDFGYASKAINEAFNQAQLPRGFTNPEGLLFPAQYSFSNETSAQQAVQQMVDRFTSEAIAREVIKGNSSFSGPELLTIASIIQAEGDTKDFEKVSRVIYNRLRIGMPLQMDSTVHFVKRVRGEIFLSLNSTLLKSPYNTYRRSGLPPGPIGSPGIAAMNAALNPAIGDWLYFITVAPGDTRFTSDIKEFNSWKVLYTKNRKAGAFE